MHHPHINKVLTSKGNTQANRETIKQSVWSVTLMQVASKLHTSMQTWHIFIDNNISRNLILIWPEKFKITWNYGSPNET